MLVKQCYWSCGRGAYRLLFLFGILAYAIHAGSSFAAPAGNQSKPATATSFVNPDKLSICLNVFQPFGYGIALGNGEKAAFTFEPYTNGGQDKEVMSDQRLGLIKATGFDCVRMVIDVGPLLAAQDDASVNRLIDQLTTGIVRRVNAGLKVIADIHPLPSGAHPVSGWSDVDLIDGTDGPKFTSLVYIVSLLARTIDAKFKPSDVALELFNEPPPSKEFQHKADWNTQIEYYWRKIRDVLPKHTIIVAGMGFAEIDGTISGDPRSGIVDLRPEHFDSNTAYAFHAYESPTFTAQAYAGFYSHVHGLTFPANKHPGGRKKAELDFIAAVNLDPVLSAREKQSFVVAFVRRRDHAFSFHRYWKEFGSEQALARRLRIVTAWADAHGLNRRQIFDTEFGVNHDQGPCQNAASSASASAFVKAIREISARERIGLITIHQLQGDCFGISSSDPPFAFDANMTRALGLK